MTQEAKGAEVPKEATPKKKVKVATQKTFIFPRTSNAEKIDEEINAWLLEQAKLSQPAQLGKVCSNHDTGDIIYVFLYPRDEEV